MVVLGRTRDDTAFLSFHSPELRHAWAEKSSNSGHAQLQTLSRIYLLAQCLVEHGLVGVLGGERPAPKKTTSVRLSSSTPHPSDIHPPHPHSVRYTRPHTHITTFRQIHIEETQQSRPFFPTMARLTVGTRGTDTPGPRSGTERVAGLLKLERVPGVGGWQDHHGSSVRDQHVAGTVVGREPVVGVALEDGPELVLETEGHGERAVVVGLTTRDHSDKKEATSTTGRCPPSLASPGRQPMPHQGCYQPERSRPNAAPPERQPQQLTRRRTVVNTGTSDPPSYSPSPAPPVRQPMPQQEYYQTERSRSSAAPPQRHNQQLTRPRREESLRPNGALPALHAQPGQCARHPSHFPDQSRLELRSDRRERARGAHRVEGLETGEHFARDVRGRGLGHSTRHRTESHRQTESKGKFGSSPPVPFPKRRSPSAWTMFGDIRKFSELDSPAWAGVSPALFYHQVQVGEPLRQGSAGRSTNRELI